MPINIKKTQIHRVANRPNLFLGGDRELVMLSLLLTFTLIFAVQTWYSFLYGIIFWIVSLYSLRKLALYDPLLRKVGLRSLTYKAFYFPRSTPFRVNTSNQIKRY